MSIAEVADEEDNFKLVDQNLRRLIDDNPIAAVASYALLTQMQKSRVQQQDYWPSLDEKIELMAYGQI